MILLILCLIRYIHIHLSHRFYNRLNV
jgi:hypothetical protein